MSRLAVLAVLLPLCAAHAQQDDDRGRDFPKTLTLDEPGIDDEVSFPTWTHAARTASAGSDTDIAFEVDKRLTTQWEVQLNGGYRLLTESGGARHVGWDDLSLTSKYVLLDRPGTETIITLGATREFGRTGAAGADADTVGSTTPSFYFGQGLGATSLPNWLRPVALTGILAYQLPDQARGRDGARLVPAFQPSASLQYSFRYLAPWIARAGLPRITERLVAVTELTYSLPISAGTGTEGPRSFAAPGLIYAGDGYQLAAEALLPLTRASGSGTGVIAQLNISFGRLGLGRIAGPLW